MSVSRFARNTFGSLTAILQLKKIGLLLPGRDAMGRHAAILQLKKIDLLPVTGSPDPLFCFVSQFSEPLRDMAQQEHHRLKVYEVQDVFITEKTELRGELIIGIPKSDDNT